MPLTSDASGVFPIAPTPFNPDGSIDWTSADRLFEFYHGIGSDGVTVLGIMGEAPKLEPEESVGLVKRAVAKMGGKPIIVGVSAPGFAAMRALTRDVMEAGAAGVMIAPPNTLRTDDSIAQYYRQASEAIGADVPFVIQDYPLTFTVQMTPAVIRRIVMENPACAMLKHEDWPGLEKISTLRGYERDGSMRHISILTGNNALFLEMLAAAVARPVFAMRSGGPGTSIGAALLTILPDAAPSPRGMPIAPREHAVAAMVHYAEAWRQAVRRDKGAAAG